MTEDIGFMDWDVYTKILNEYTPSSIKLNWRGEPLLHKQICEMVAYAKDIGVIEVLLNTNATHLTRQMINHLSDMGLDVLIISADGASKLVYEKIRKPANFEVFFKNVVTASLYFTGEIRIQACRQPINQKEIDSGKWAEVYEPLADTLRVGQLYDPQGLLGLNINQPKFCPSFWQRLTIGWNGNISPCPSDYQGHWGLGNIKDITIYDAWHSTRMNYFRYNLAKYGRKAVPACKNCTSYC